jgi:hypothetical protein
VRVLDIQSDVRRMRLVAQSLYVSAFPPLPVRGILAKPRSWHPSPSGPHRGWKWALLQGIWPAARHYLDLHSAVEGDAGAAAPPVGFYAAMTFAFLSGLFPEAVEKEGDCSSLERMVAEIEKGGDP